MSCWIWRCCWEGWCRGTLPWPDTWASPRPAVSRTPICCRGSWLEEVEEEQECDQSPQTKATFSSGDFLLLILWQSWELSNVFFVPWQLEASWAEKKKHFLIIRRRKWKNVLFQFSLKGIIISHLWCELKLELHYFWSCFEILSHSLPIFWSNHLQIKPK